MKPKLPSELHPQFPQRKTFEDAESYYQALKAFYIKHTEFKDEGSYDYRCTSCGEPLHDEEYCSRCDHHGGYWVLVDDNGDEI